MRVTESRMWQLATDAVAAARERVAQTGQALQSGVRVDRPSEDVAAWSQGERAAVRRAMSQARGGGLATARDTLARTDDALGAITTALTRLNELAVQGANGTLSASDRTELASQVSALRATSLAAANRQALDGSYLLGGTQAAVAPFSAAGAYRGDGIARTLETGEATRASVGVTGDALTAANGVDVLAVFDTLATALGANDVAGVQAALPQLQQAIAQVATLRTGVGARLNALDQADDARQSFEQSLTESHARAVETDPVAAASDLTQAGNALSAARASAQQLLSLLQNL